MLAGHNETSRRARRLIVFGEMAYDDGSDRPLMGSGSHNPNRPHMLLSDVNGIRSGSLGQVYGATATSDLPDSLMPPDSPLWNADDGQAIAGDYHDSPRPSPQRSSYQAVSPGRSYSRDYSARPGSRSRREWGAMGHTNSMSPNPPQNAMPDSPKWSAGGHLHGTTINNTATGFTPVYTMWLSALHCLVIVANAFQVWTDLLEPRARFVLIQASMFVFFTLTYTLLRREHKSAQQRGHLDFFVNANAYVRFVFFTAAFGVCIICVSFVYWDTSDKLGPFTRDLSLRIIVSLQSAVELAAMVLYSRLVIRHNEQQPLPDVSYLQDLPAALTTGTNRGHNSPPPTPRRLLKKQAGIIKFLESRIHSLSTELVKIQDEQERGGVAPSSDINHLLQAKEQAIRALRVERDTLRRDISALQDENAELEKMSDIVRSQSYQSVSQMDLQKSTISSQAQEIARLVHLLAVQREAVQVARKQIESLEANRSSHVRSASRGATPTPAGSAPGQLTGTGSVP